MIIILYIGIVIVLLLGGYFFIRFAENWAKSSPKPKKPAAPETEAEVVEVVEIPSEPIVADKPPPVEEDDSPRNERYEVNNLPKINRSNRRRILDYYEQRWSPSTDHYQIDDGGTDDNQATQISQEDVRKLLVLKDMFERKTPPNTN